MFADETTLKFRTTTVAHLSRLMLADPTGNTAESFYRQLVMENLDALERVLRWCHANRVRAFRIGSDLWPRATHPLVRPWVDRLFDDATTQATFERIRLDAERYDVRLSEHPDQFLVGNSVRADVVNSTITELEWRGRLAAALGVDVICLHGGSGAPDRESSLWRWEPTLARLSPNVLSRLALENDDRTFTPEDLLPGCLAWDLPFIYDVHHHRVHRDSLSEEDATLLSIASWGDREPFFHLSSPRDGWDARDARPHHDLIDPNDWPDAWRSLADAGVRFTVDIEAKAKERAIFALRPTLEQQPSV